MTDSKVNYGIDVHQRYEAHQFDLEAKAKTDRDIRETFRKLGWVPPSEQKREAA